MEDKILEELYRQFPNVRERKGQGNKMFKYVASNDIIDRMNRVFKGDWSVHITHFELIEDNILVRVQVTVSDHLTNGVIMNYSQEAFASHPLARFTTGDRKGQIIDLGNSYRAAVSKALKAAVERWGVGLYLEEEGEEGEIHNPTFNSPPPAVGSVPPGVPFKVSEEKQAVPPKEKGVVPQPASSFTPPPFVVPKSAPPPDVSKPVSAAPPIPQVQSGSEDKWTAPVVEPPKEPKEPEYLTDVQKVALETILQMNGLEYAETAKKVLETDSFPPIEKLLYMQAVKLIQYGNNLKLGK